MSVIAISFHCDQHGAHCDQHGAPLR